MSKTKKKRNPELAPENTTFILPTRDNIYTFESNNPGEGEKVRCRLCDSSIFARNKTPHEKSIKHLKACNKLTVGKPIDIQDIQDVKNSAVSNQIEFQAHVIQSLKELSDAVDLLTEMVEDLLCEDEEELDAVPEEKEPATTAQ